MSIQILNNAQALLSQAGIETARLDAEVILAHVLGASRADLYTSRHRTVSDQDILCFNEYINRRAMGTPVAYITGVKEFWSLPIKVTDAVMIPRPETELVVERALAIVGAQAPKRPGAYVTNILDLCAGSGCIAAALAKEMPHARFVVTDISGRALDVARENLAFATGRVEFCLGDLFEALTNTQAPMGPGAQGQYFDLITSNPPYIAMQDRDALPREVTNHEPDVALYGGESGLDFVSGIIKDAFRFLRPGGWLVMEMGEGQADTLMAIATQCKTYDNIVISKDLAGIERVITIKSVIKPLKGLNN